MDPGESKTRIMTPCALVVLQLELIFKSHWISWSPYGVKSGHGVGAVLALDDGFLVRVVPVLKLRVELDGDDLQVARVVVPGEVTVYTDDIHVRSLWIR